MKKKVRAGGAKLGPIMQITLICLAAYVALLGLLFSGVTPQQYDIQVGAPAPIQILATKDVLDTVTTDALREAAAAAVEPSYKSADPNVVTEVMQDLNAEFDRLRELRAGLQSVDLDALSEADIAALTPWSDFALSRDQLRAVREADDATFEAALTDAVNEVHDTLASTLPEGQEDAAVRSLRAELEKTYGATLAEALSGLVRRCIQPTMLIDETITEENRNKAREAVEPEMCVKGEVIVREGDIVTPAQYTMISSLGLLSENSFDVQLFAGVAMLVLLAMATMGFYLWRFHRKLLTSPKQMLLLCVIVVLTTAICTGLREINVYLTPVTLGLLLVALLVDVHLALFVNVLLALLAGALISAGSTSYSVMLMTVICGPMIAVLFSKSMLRTTTLLAGLCIAVSNFFVTLAVGLFSSAEMQGVLVNALWAAGGGALSAVLCIGIQPLLEWLFNLATAAKLIELSNPNQPLLRRLLLEASGTYHHSIIVANLAEAGCTAIGANGLLARVGAYYHDIGKLKRPMYFKENQMGDNPHDRTDPRVSAAILTAHTRDGAQMAQKARIPQPVIDIIRQHHGDTPTIYFYDKAKKLYGDSIDISAFRYEGPCPQTREAAVVMLADGIEAATRAMSNPDPEKIDALIRNFVRARLNDGQLDSSDLTFSDLDKICGAFSTVLTGAFHERIEYPTVVIPPRGEAVAEKPEESGGEADSSTAQTGAGNASASTAAQTGPANAAQINGNTNAVAQPGVKPVGTANNGSQPAAGSASGQNNGTANNAAPSAAGQSVSASVQSNGAGNASAQPVRTANPAGQPAQSSVAPQTMAANAAHPIAQSNGAGTASAQPVCTATPAGQPAQSSVPSNASAQPIPAHPVPGAPVPPMGGSGPSVGMAQEAVGAQNAQAFARPAGQAAPEFVSAGRPVPPSEEEGGERV